MSTPEQNDDIELIGQVSWGFKRTGYAGGLEKLGDKMDLSSWRKSADYDRVYFFAREVAIAVANSKACQADPRKKAQDLINRNLLTAAEMDYVYAQFGFDPDNFVPPDWMKRIG